MTSCWFGKLNIFMFKFINLILKSQFRFCVSVLGIYFSLSCFYRSTSTFDPSPQSAGSSATSSTFPTTPYTSASPFTSESCPSPSPWSPCYTCEPQIPWSAPYRYPPTAASVGFGPTTSGVSATTAILQSAPADSSATGNYVSKVKTQIPTIFFWDSLNFICTDMIYWKCSCHIFWVHMYHDVINHKIYLGCLASI